MKPRITLAEAPLQNGTTLGLHEHDGRRYIQLGAVQLAGPATRVSEQELGRIGCSPFKSVRQPKIWLAGLGLGEVLAGAMESLPQKRAVFHVAEPWTVIPRWHREFLPESPVNDSRVELLEDAGASGLHAFENELHAVLVHADTVPIGERERGPYEDRRWLVAAHDALQPGGLLGIASSRPVPDLERKLARAGFDTVRHELDASPNARRPRRHFLWLARKGKSSD